MSEENVDLPEQGGAELDQNQAQAEENAFKKYLQENELDEETFLNKYKELEENSKRLQEDYEAYEEQLERLNSQQTNNQNNSQPASNIPVDKQQFFNKFAENPNEVLQEAFNEYSKPYNDYIANLERDVAIQYMETQKDYYDGMERDVERVIRKNQGLLQSARPIDRMKFALREIRRDKRPTERKVAPKPASVSTPTKNSSPSKDPNAMSAEELKQFLFQNGAGIGEY